MVVVKGHIFSWSTPEDHEPNSVACMRCSHQVVFAEADDPMPPHSEPFTINAERTETHVAATFQGGLGSVPDAILPRCQLASSPEIEAPAPA